MLLFILAALTDPHVHIAGWLGCLGLRAGCAGLGCPSPPAKGKRWAAAQAPAGGHTHTGLVTG